MAALAKRFINAVDPTIAKPAFVSKTRVDPNDPQRGNVYMAAIPSPTKHGLFQLWELSTNKDVKPLPIKNGDTFKLSDALKAAALYEIAYSYLRALAPVTIGTSPHFSEFVAETSNNGKPKPDRAIKIA